MSTPVQLPWFDHPKLFFNRLQSAFSDIRVTTHEAISDGDFVCLRWSATMRHTGDALGMPATHKQLHTSGISIVRVKEGRFAEAWQNWDMLGVTQQIRKIQWCARRDSNSRPTGSKPAALSN